MPTETSSPQTGWMATYDGTKRSDRETRGDADVARVAALFAEPTRARVLMALADGRALPASVLAAEAGLSASATSGHLALLREAGLVTVEPSGRHRYYRLAGPDVASVLEALARVAPTAPIRSLRQGTRARALREARTCYDHVAGRLGVAMTAGLLERGALVATDGVLGPERRPGDALSSQVRDHPYRLGPYAVQVFAAVGVDLPALREPTRRSRRPLLRCCLDWTEQRHHLAGRLGAALTEAMFDQGWMVRQSGQRAVRLTPEGVDGLAATLGIEPDALTDRP